MHSSPQVYQSMKIKITLKVELDLQGSDQLRKTADFMDLSL
jgi:hypothetical protein